jgi:hypothetical protein
MTRLIALGAAALGLACFAVPASAQQYGAPIPFRLLSDPAYLPLQGQWYGSTAFTVENSSGDAYDSTGAKTATRKGWEDEITQELEYGVTNDVTVRVADSYVPYDKHKDEFTAGGFSDHDRTGFHDPSVGVTWRVIDQANRNPVNLDLLADYKANLIDARTSNVAEGGQSGEFGAALSKVMPHFTIYGKAVADWYGSQSEFNPTTTDFAREESYWDYLVDLDTQTRLNDLFSIDAGIGYVFANNAHVANLTTGVSHIAEPGNGLKLNAALNYQVVPNTLVASLTYDYRRDNTSQQIYALPAADTFLRNHDDNQFGVKLDYVMP